MATNRSRQTRREMLSGMSKLAGATLLSRRLLLGGDEASAAGYAPKLSVEIYIWIQHLASEKKTLAEGVDEVLASFHGAGYRRVELNQDFFKPELREKTLALLAKYNLAPETIYAGTTMHEAAAAEKSVKEVMELARLLKLRGTRVIVTNPSPKPAQARKTDEELDIQAKYVDQLGAALHQQGMKLALHHHTPELVDNAREWRHLLQHTNPRRVYCCVDVHWAYRGGQEVMAFIRETGQRLVELHLRNSQQGVWMEDFGPGDIDYQKVADYLRGISFKGYLVVELAYEKGTQITRSLDEDLRLSRQYAEKVFGLPGSA
jgi:inosose dehydratase